MLTITCITTNHPKRFDVLLKTIRNVDSFGYRLPKILSVDEFKDIPTDLKFFNQISDAGWRILFRRQEGKNSMVMNILNALSAVDTEWVWHLEDDVTFRDMVKSDSLPELLTSNLGFVSFNAHVNERPNDQTDAYVSERINYRKFHDKFLLMKSPDIFQKMWYFNFPSCVIRKRHLERCLKHGLDAYKDQKVSIEEGISRAWLGIEEYRNLECSIILNRIPDLSNVKSIYEALHSAAVMNYWNNDTSARIEPVNHKQSMWY